MHVRNPMIIHYVHDMDRALAFYKNAFDVAISFESPGWSTLEFGTFRLALHMLFPGHTDEAPIPHAGLNLEVDVIEDMQSRIETHGGRLVELREADQFVPDRVASFTDTEGNGFELRQNVGVVE